MKIKNIVYALIGNIVLGAGVAFESLPLLGSDPSISFSQAASSVLNISIGQMITITNICLLTIALIIAKKNIGVATLIVVLLNQYPIDFFTSLVNRSSYLAINIIYIVIGCLLVAIGCNIIIISNLGMGIYDAFIFGIADKVGKDYVLVRYIVDGIFLSLTIILKGYIGIGTIIPYILIGNLIKLTKPYIVKLFK